jgi:hypothetical protein
MTVGPVGSNGAVEVQAGSKAAEKSTPNNMLALITLSLTEPVQAGNGRKYSRYKIQASEEQNGQFGQRETYEKQTPVAQI